MTITNDHLFAIQTLRFTLEHILDEFAQECSRAKPRKGQLNRQEAVMKRAFMSMAADLLNTMQTVRFTYESTPLLDGVLKDMAANRESAEFAVTRFVLNHRYPTK